MQEFDDYSIDQEIEENNNWDEFKKRQVDEALLAKAKDRDHFVDFKKY